MTAERNHGRKYARAKTACAYFQISPSTLWHWLKTREGFPKPMKAGKKVTLFDLGEIEAYLQGEAMGGQRAEPAGAGNTPAAPNAAVSRTVSRGLAFVRHEELTHEQRCKNADAQAKAATLAGMIRTPRLPEQELTHEQRCKNADAQAKAATLAGMIRTPRLPEQELTHEQRRKNADAQAKAAMLAGMIRTPRLPEHDAQYVQSGSRAKRGI